MREEGGFLRREGGGPSPGGRPLRPCCCRRLRGPAGIGTGTARHRAGDRTAAAAAAAATAGLTVSAGQA
jgi:hypothetical protein